MSDKSKEISFSGSKTHSCGTLKLQKDRQEGQFYCDVILLLNGGELKAHKTVLASCSEYFDDLFKTKVKQNATCSVDLTSLDKEAVEKILDFMYLSEITISIGDIWNVVKVADFMELDELIEVCEKFLQDNITGSNCITIRSLARKYNLQNLLKKAEQFLSDSLLLIADNEDFMECNQEELTDIIDKRNQTTTSETVAYEVIIKWTKHELTARMKLIDDMMALLVFTRMNATFLAKTVATEELVKNSLICQNMVIQALAYHLKVSEDFDIANPYNLEKGQAINRKEELHREFVELNEMIKEPNITTGYFMIPAQWYTQWQNYVSVATRDLSTMTVHPSPPGPIDTRSLCADKECCYMKEGMLNGRDFLLISQDAWEYITQRHGVNPYKKPLIFETEDVYEKVKLKFITAAKNIKRGKQPTTIVQSFNRHETTIHAMYTTMRSQFGFYTHKPYHPYSLTTNQVKRVEKPQWSNALDTLDKWGLRNGDMIVINR